MGAARRSRVRRSRDWDARRGEAAARGLTLLPLGKFLQTRRVGLRVLFVPVRGRAEFVLQR